MIGLEHANLLGWARKSGLLAIGVRCLRTGLPLAAKRLRRCRRRHIGHVYRPRCSPFVNWLARGRTCLTCSGG